MSATRQPEKLPSRLQSKMENSHSTPASEAVPGVGAPGTGPFLALSVWESLPTLLQGQQQVRGWGKEQLNSIMERNGNPNLDHPCIYGAGLMVGSVVHGDRDGERMGNERRHICFLYKKKVQRPSKLSQESEKIRSYWFKEIEQHSPNMSRF